MTSDQISLLVYLESRMVMHSGMLNEKELSPADMKTMIMWHDMGMLELKKLKLPDRTPDPIYTHKIRMSRPLYELAWQARLEKAEQHNPTLQLEGDPAPEEAEDHEMFEDFQSFIKAHGEKLGHVQADLAKELFGVLSQQKYRFFLGAKNTGKTWLFSTIDQYFKALRTVKEKGG